MANCLQIIEMGDFLDQLADVGVVRCREFILIRKIFVLKYFRFFINFKNCSVGGLIRNFR